MRRLGLVFVGFAAIAAALIETATAQDDVRRLPVRRYVDKMQAGWIGQMAGVGWGGPTEWWCRGEIMAENRVPKWHPGLINQFNQDDIYVEMTFLQTLETHGLDVSIRQAGIDFANSRYRLWCANKTGRDNLRKGIAPPDSSHPKLNPNADDIDYQIEADYSGLIAPGMPQLAIELGEKFGRLMNYGDGLYAGQFVGAMYAEAFFEDDIVKIIKTALRAIPAESQYAEMVRDMLAWYEKNPDDWQKTWQWVEDKYHKDPRYSHGLWKLTEAGAKGEQNIDAKLNGAYILMGLLYGKGDPDQTIVISIRCGQDSDCNPSNAAGILFTTMGLEKVPARFKSALNPEGKFSHTPYDFPKLIDVSKVLVRQAVERGGGRIEKQANGEEVFVIPVVASQPSELMRSWEPGPIAGSKFTDAEMAKIQATSSGVHTKTDIGTDLEKFAPGWKSDNCGVAENPGLHASRGGREKVLVTHPLNGSMPCVLTKTVDIPTGRKTRLVIEVGHDPRGDWILLVTANGKQVKQEIIGGRTCIDGWTEVRVDLSGYAGKSVSLGLENRANGWHFETGYWSHIAIESD